MANVLSVPLSGNIYFECGSQSSTVPNLTGSAVSFGYDGCAGVKVTSFNTAASATDRFTVAGESGSLFSVNDALTGTVFSVNDASGLPIIEVNSDAITDTIAIGEYGTNALFVSAGNVGVGTATPTSPLDVAGNINTTGNILSSGVDLAGIFALASSAGDITAVTAGTGLNGGGTSGSVTLNVDNALSNVTSLGTLTSLTVDDITINGSTISDSGDFTLDVGGDISLDADDAGTVKFKDGGTEFGRIYNASSNLYIKSIVSDKDLVFVGNDGGSAVEALRLDMSDAGTATFNHNVNLPDGGQLNIGANADLYLTHDDNNGYFYNNKGDLFIDQTASDSDIVFKGTDGGSDITALRLDMSDGGSAIFNNWVCIGAGSLKLGGIAVTSTAAELNKLDGFTGTCDDLNYAKDLRATGVTTTEFNCLDGLTATTANLNLLAGCGSIPGACCIGDITGVTAGTGMTGGGTSGTPTLNVIGGTGITANANDVAIDTGVVMNLASAQTASGTKNFSGSICVGGNITHTGDSDTGITFDTNEINICTGGENHIKLCNGGVVVNEFGSANDFRVEGDTDTHALFVDGSADKVGIGCNAPSQKLAVAGDGLFTSDLTVQGDLTVTGDFTCLDTTISVTSALSVQNAGTGPALIVNQTGSNDIVDFRDDGTSVFYIEDGGNVGLGDTNPAHTLDVNGNINTKGAYYMDDAIVINNTKCFVGAQVRPTTAIADAYIASAVAWNACATTAQGTKADNALPKSGGTMTGHIAMSNCDITGVNIFCFNDPGPNEGIHWTGGNTKIFESPDNLTTNSAGNLQMVYGSTRRLTVNNTGIDVNGNIVVSGTVDGVDIAARDAILTGVTNCPGLACIGDITGVTAGTGMTGGGTSGTPTLNVIGGDGITANANDVTVDSTVVRTSGAQTIAGTKNFSGSICVGGNITHTGDSNTCIQFDTDAICLFTGGENHICVGNGGVVINESSNDNDFRVEGNNDGYALFLDASSDKVGIGVSVPGEKLTVSGNLSACGTGFVDKLGVGAEPSGDEVLTVDGTAGNLFTITNSVTGTVFAVSDSAGLPILEAFTDSCDMITMGEYGSNALVVCDTKVGIGNATPTSPLDVTGNIAVTGTVDGVDIAARDAILTGVTNCPGLACVGDITAVTAGNGLTGGATSGGATLNVGAGTAITVAADTVGVNSTCNSTWNAKTTCTGTVTSITVNTAAGLDGAGTITSSGTLNLSLDLSELTDMTGGIDTAVDEIILLDNGAERRKRFAEIFGSNAYNSTTIPTNNNQLTNGAGYTPCTGTTTPSNTQTFTNKSGNISQWTNNSGYTTCTGDITAVVAGTNLNGGATSGSATLNLDSAISITSATIGSGVTLSESTDRADLLYVNSSTDSWGGLQIGNTSNEFIFSLMGNGTQGGIYDDQQNEWLILWTENAGVNLYHNNSSKLCTTSTGVNVGGSITVTGTVDGVDIAARDAILTGVTNCPGLACVGDITAVTAGNGLTGGATSGGATLNVGAGTAITVAADTVSVNSTCNSTWNAKTTCTGTVTSIATGTGLDGTFTTSGTITLDLSELTDMTGGIDTAVDELILLDNGAERRKRFAEIFGSNAYNSTTIPTNNNQLTNGSGYTTCTGDITAVVAGTDLTGGATSGSATLNVTSATASTANTIVKREGSGDICARLFRSEYDTTNSTIGFIMTQIDTGSNNYIRPSTPAQLRTGLNVANGATACTGTTTPSNTQTFTNKSGNISQWTNNSGYTTCTGTTTPSNTQTFTNKSGNISQWTNNSGYTTCTGDITGVTAGSLLDGGGTSGSVTLNVDLSELTDGTGAIVPTSDEIVYLDAGSQKRKLFSEIFGSNAYNSTTIPTNNNQLTNGAGYTTNTGDITAVVAGNGLTGGATSGSATVNVGAGTAITVAADTVGVTTACNTAWNLASTRAIALITCAGLACTGTLGGDFLQDVVFTDGGVKLGLCAGHNITETSGIQNVTIGCGAGCNITTGDRNTYVGACAGRGGNGSDNVAIGRAAMFNNGGASNNVGIGLCALRGAASSTGTNNIGVGRCALLNITSGGQNMALGDAPLFCVTSGARNVGIGPNAGRHITGSDNLVFGNSSGCGIVNGSNNVAIGKYAMRTTTNNGTGQRNVAIGENALNVITSGCNNVSLGFCAHKALTSGKCNVAIGSCAGANAALTGIQNISIGEAAAWKSTSANGNIALGFAALGCNTGGDCNIAIGHQAGRLYSSSGQVTSGTHNVWIGYNTKSGGSTASPTNQIAIGKDAQACGNNTIKLGNSSITVVCSNGSFSTVSDIRDKTCICDLEFGLDFIGDLKPKTFNMITDRNDPEGSISCKRHGFIAQEVLELEGSDPVVVRDDNPDQLGFTSDHIIPILVKGMQEQQAIIDNLTARLEALEG